MDKNTFIIDLDESLQEFEQKLLPYINAKKENDTILCHITRENTTELDNQNKEHQKHIISYVFEFVNGTPKSNNWGDFSGDITKRINFKE